MCLTGMGDRGGDRGGFDRGFGGRGRGDRGRGDRGRGRGRPRGNRKDEEEKWVPCTKLGRLVQQVRRPFLWTTYQMQSQMQLSCKMDSRG